MRVCFMARVQGGRVEVRGGVGRERHNNYYRSIKATTIIPSSSSSIVILFFVIVTNYNCL